MLTAVRIVLYSRLAKNYDFGIKVSIRIYAARVERRGKMIRHISIFFLKDGVTKEEKGHVEIALGELKNELTGIADYRTGTNCLPPPPLGAANAPRFGDLVQVIDFVSREEAKNYPGHSGHRKLLEATSAYMKEVIAVDFEL